MLFKSSVFNTSKFFIAIGSFLSFLGNNYIPLFWFLEKGNPVIESFFKKK